MLGWLIQLFTRRKREASAAAPPSAMPVRLQGITLTEGVAQTLRDDYAAHRQSERGHEEIGWILLGIRQDNEAIALAALPAGAERDAGAAHVQFNSDVQELASHILRQYERRLKMIAVVHTHPGSMRYPSDGDLQGDRRWVAGLPTGEGVFAIGTADARAGESAKHLQVFADICFSWYALGKSDREYRALPIRLIPGADLAGPLRTHWELIEAFATPLNRLYRQLTRLHIAMLKDDEQNVLCVRIGLSEKNQQIRLLLSGAEARYYWEREGELIAIDPHEELLDRAVFLILAELAKEAAAEEKTLVES